VGKKICWVETKMSSRRKNALGIPTGRSRPIARNPPRAKVKADPEPTAPKKESKVLKAASKAEETLRKIKEDEEMERQRAKNIQETKVHGGELDWRQYLKPHDIKNFDDCQKIDQYNHAVYQFNNAMLPRVNELMKKLGLNPKHCDAPTKYVPIYKANYEKMLFNDEFRLLKAIEYLARREKYPIRDYRLGDEAEVKAVPVQADDIAMEEEIQRLVTHYGEEGIDISVAAGKGHKNNCTCENRWDGRSERCMGEGIRLRWRKLKDHHFLRPRVVAEKY
jgi:hypothetical protein